LTAPNILSVTYEPHYRTVAGLPIVQDAARRVLWDDASETTETISASAYEDASGAEMHALCAALDRHPRERR
jgi:hypothetical protein